jgi:hypothetical protein
VTIPPRPPYTDSNPVWVHLMTLALVADVGLVVAVALGLALIPWAETIGVCIWFAGLCALAANNLTKRLRLPT